MEPGATCMVPICIMSFIKSLSEETSEESICSTCGRKVFLDMVCCCLVFGLEREKEILIIALEIVIW